MSDNKKELPEFMQKAVQRTKGNKIADFSDGQKFDHHWGRTINAGDNSLYCSLMQMYNPIYFNDACAKEEGHNGTVVNPFLVFNTILGLSVEDLSEGGGGPFVGINDCEFLAPVYEGDTLTAHSTVVGKRSSESRPGAAIVTWATEGRNQHGEVVVKFVRSNLLFI